MGSLLNECFFDIETISTRRPDYRYRVASTIKPPASMKKAETIAKWEAEEKESAITELVEKSVFNGGLCHVVQIQWAFGDGAVRVVQSEDENVVISRFFLALENERCVDKFVGHHITGFDFRILKQRAMVLGIAIPFSLQKAIDSKPWDSYVFDTMYEWAGVKDSVSMDNLCYYLGVESPKGEVDGSRFGAYFSSGDMSACARYGVAEIESLRNVYKKMCRVYE
jgi:hypothetical protein